MGCTFFTHRFSFPFLSFRLSFFLFPFSFSSFSSLLFRLSSLPLLTFWFQSKMNATPLLTLTANKTLSNIQVFPHWLRKTTKKKKMLPVNRPLLTSVPSHLLKSRKQKRQKTIKKKNKRPASSDRRPPTTDQDPEDDVELVERKPSRDSARRTRNLPCLRSVKATQRLRRR